MCENLKSIVDKYSQLFGRHYKNTKTGKVCIFDGILIGKDDYYYSLIDRDWAPHYLSCCIELSSETSGYELLENSDELLSDMRKTATLLDLNKKVDKIINLLEH